MSVEEIQSLAKMILITLASGIGGIATLGFVVVAFFMFEMDE